MVASPTGVRPENELRWLRPAAIVNDRSILSSYMSYDRRCSIEKKNSGRGLKRLGVKMNWLAVNRQS
jgi:hypothetical protein